MPTSVMADSQKQAVVWKASAWSARLPSTGARDSMSAMHYAALHPSGVHKLTRSRPCSLACFFARFARSGN